jgi:predicted permease
MFQDLRYGVRMLLKKPGFTLGVMLSLTLGIGLNTTIFTVVNALLLAPLPGVEQPQNLVGIYSTRQGSGYFNVAYPDFAYFREHSQSFSSMAAHWPTPFALGNGGDPVKVDGAIVSGNYFATLGLNLALGRFFLPEEDRTPGAHPVVVISHKLWQRHFNSAPEVIGKTIALNGQRFTVVGVAPAGFNGTLTGLAAELWVPLMMHAVVLPDKGELARGPNMLHLMAFGRLKPGVGLARAQAELNGCARQLEQQFPDTNKERGVNLASASGAHPALRGVLTAFLAILMAVVVIVLLIACANVANLLLASAAARSKEIAVRLSLGATRWRLVRQLLTESVLLSLGSGVLGIFLAIWATDFFLSLLPPTGLPFAPDLSLDRRVLGFTLSLSLLTGIVFGLAPALQATKPDLAQALKDEMATGSYRRARLRSLLIVVQIALSALLLIGAGLLIRSLRHAQTLDPGFDTERLLTLSFDTKLLGYDATKSETFQQELLRRVAALPGVQRASIARFIPLGPAGDSLPAVLEGQPPEREITIGYNLVGQDYFQTLGIPLLRGRGFTAQDRRGSSNVLVINEAMAQRLRPNAEPVGQRLRIRNESFEVIGVARNSKYRSLSEELRPFLYLSVLQREAARIPAGDLKLLVRSAGEPAGVIAAIRKEAQALDANLPLFDVQTLNEGMRFALIPTQLAGTLLGVAGVLALVLATVGIYGVVAYAVGQRTREIGIRLALGAQAADVLKLVIRQGLLLTSIGIALGLAAALALTRVMSSFLLGVSATDPLTFIVIALLLTFVALLACWIPAWRATKVDPMIALRCE